MRLPPLVGKVKGGLLVLPVVVMAVKRLRGARLRATGLPPASTETLVDMMVAALSLLVVYECIAMCVREKKRVECLCCVLECRRFSWMVDG